MKKIFFAAALLFSVAATKAQYNFTDKINIEATDVKNQGSTGTCWSFSTTSFIEAEAIRLGHKDVDFSEMYTVYNTYIDKANNYVSRQGKANFSQGSLAHDVLRMIDMHGIVPQTVYTALLENETRYNHSEMEKALKGFLDGVIASGKPSKKWREAFKGILNAYMGKTETSFEVEGKTYNAKSYAKAMGIEASNYVSISSFTHAPFYSSFILNIPDNYSNQSFYNMPLQEMVDVVDKALEKGYTIEWDGDVSEKGFGRKEGVAVLPANPKSDFLNTPSKEINVTQALRQASFEDYTTTDDHLMHLVGKAEDQNGNVYYIIKNSWGNYSPYGGYLYMSEAYFKMKTVSVTLHKDVAPKKATM
jgi:bleomycin hydrolase